MIFDSSGNQGGFLAATVPGFNAFKLLLLGLEMRKDEKAVKLMSGLGDHYRFWHLNKMYQNTKPDYVKDINFLIPHSTSNPSYSREMGNPIKLYNLLQRRPIYAKRVHQHTSRLFLLQELGFDSNPRAKEGSYIPSGCRFTFDKLI